MEAVYQGLAARIRIIREALGVTQEELATRLNGLTRTTIVNMEAGRQRISMHQVENIAAALGTTPKHLLRGIWW